MDEKRRRARVREQRQSAALLSGMVFFWAVVLTLNHLVHVFSTAYIASAQ